MTDQRADDTLAFSSVERMGLSLVFGGPISLWVAMARLVGVQVGSPAEVDDSLMSKAEAGAHLAARRFTLGLVASTVAVGALAVWSPAQTALIEPLMHAGFHEVADNALLRGSSFNGALLLAGSALMLSGVIVGVLNAIVFGLIPMYLLRRSAAAAAPAVSIALASQSGTVQADEYAAYPRVTFAVERILHKRRW